MRQAAAVRNLHLGITLISRGRYDQAARTLELALNLKPDWPEALRRLAQCRALLGDYAGCRAPAEALLAADPEQPWGHLIMATSLTLGGDSEAAKPYVENARRLGAEVPEVLIRLGGLALNRGATKRLWNSSAKHSGSSPTGPTGFTASGRPWPIKATSQPPSTRCERPCRRNIACRLRISAWAWRWRRRGGGGRRWRRWRPRRPRSRTSLRSPRRLSRRARLWRIRLA